MGCTIACAGALLSQQRCSLLSSALYSSLQNIIAHQAYVLKRFIKKNKLFEKKKKQKDTGLNRVKKDWFM
jgi:hypothetical protein